MNTEELTLEEQKQSLKHYNRELKENNYTAIDSSGKIGKSCCAIANFVTASDLRKREPGLARLKQNDEELKALIDKAFTDFCLQYKEEQGSVPSTTAPIYFLNHENTTDNKVVQVTVDDYNKRVINRFVIEKEITLIEGVNKILLRGSTDGVSYTLIREILISNSEPQSFIFYVSYPYLECEIVKDEELDINLTCYLTESPYDTLIEFLALSYVFESLIKTNDIYIVKADRYRALYYERFTKLNSEYTNGPYAMCKVIRILK
jgi:hypothetical protein